MSRTKVIAVLVLLAGLAFGALTIAIARREPAFAFVGGEIKLDTDDNIGGGWLLSPARVAAELAAGWALLAVGLAAWVRRPRRDLRAASCRRRVRLVRARVEQPRHRLGGGVRVRPHPLRRRSAADRPRRARLSDRRLPWPERLVVAIAYIDALFVLGLGSALVFDPTRACARSARPILFSSRARPCLVDAFNRVGVHVGLGWSVAAGLLIGLRLARSTSAARALALAGARCPRRPISGLSRWHSRTASSAAARDGHDAARPLARAGAALWSHSQPVSPGRWIRARYTRAAMARLVVDIAESPIPGEPSRAARPHARRRFARDRLSARGTAGSSMRTAGRSRSPVK